MVPAAVRFQYTMVARLDDTCQFKEEDLKSSPQFPFALVCRMCWSKNVLEERDAPDQIILGSMDRRYCILLALGIFLEVWTEAGDGLANPYLFGNTGNPETTKTRLYEILKNVWDSNEFERLAEGPIGTHSLRKFPSTQARRNGCSKDDVDSRGRWRKRRVVDRYIDVNLPYPDAKVAAALCVGGPCKYVLKNGSGITSNWLYQHVVPNMRQSQHITDQVALVLALPLLWACLSPDMQAYLPGELRNRICTAYQNICQLEPGENPVKKVLLVITGEDAEVHIDEVFDDNDQPPANNNNNNNEIQPQDPQMAANLQPNNNLNTRGIQNANFRALYAQNTALRREVQELRTEVQRVGERETQHFGILNTSIRRIALQPVQRPRNNNNNANGNNNNNNNNNNNHNAATLSPNPRTLHVLWQEYEFGIGGRKAARLFTAAERGRVKYSYHRRKVVWDKIAEMIRAGHTAQTAIDRIYQAYGVNTTTTRIINLMRRDRTTGGHPDLQV